MSLSSASKKDKMKGFSLLQRVFKLFLCSLISGIILLKINIQNVNSLTMDTIQGEFVIEELRLKVPAEAKEVWLNAEKKNMGTMVIFSKWFFRETIILE